MNTKKLKEIGTDLIAVADELEATTDKGKINDLYISLDLLFDELEKIKEVL